MPQKSHVLIDPETHRRLKVVSADLGCTIGDVVRQLVDSIDDADSPSLAIHRLLVDAKHPTVTGRALRRSLAGRVQG